jgi:hypothetical protein
MPENVPTRIVQAAVERGLHAIGICDHNASENVAAVRRAAERSAHAGLRVFGGIEVTTREEVHLLSIFEREVDLNRMQETVYETLQGENSPDAFGEQYIVDDEDYVIGTNRRLLLGATGLSVEETVDCIHRYGGLAVASHIDREAFSIMSQLGFVPENTAFDALEFSKNYSSSPFDITGYLAPGGSPPDGTLPGGSPGAKPPGGSPPVVTFSDAHQLDQIGRTYTEFRVEEATMEELKLALRGAEGREVSPVFG